MSAAPSKAALRRHRERLAAEVKALRGANASAVIKRLNPIIRGWSAYYRTVVSSEAFAKLDSHLWTLAYKWARHSHNNKSRGWVRHQYFDAFNKSRRDRWVFGDRDSGAYLLRHAWTNIVRHQMVPGTASPDDPALADYWARRRQRHPPPLDGVSLRLLKAQHGRCATCGQLLLLADHEPQTLPQCGAVVRGYPESHPPQSGHCSPEPWIRGRRRHHPTHPLPLQARDPIGACLSPVR